MHRGYFKIWRKTLESDVWLLSPYSPLKLWMWMISEACWPEKARKRDVTLGSFTTTYETMRDEMVWHDTERHRDIRPSKPTIYRHVQRFIEAEMITVETIGASKHSFSLITVCNYEIYNGDNDTPCNAKKTTRKTTRKTIPKKVQESSRKTANRHSSRQPYEPSEFAVKAYAWWTERSSLLTPKETELKALDKLVRECGSTESAAKICRKAVYDWLPREIVVSPQSLVKSRGKGKPKTWMNIQQQIDAPSASAGLVDKIFRELNPEAPDELA